MIGKIVHTFVGLEYKCEDLHRKSCMSKKFLESNGSSISESINEKFDRSWVQENQKTHCNRSIIKLLADEVVCFVTSDPSEKK